MARKIIFIFISLFIFGCSNSLVKKNQNSGIKGTALHNKHPISGISVFAYKNFNSRLYGSDYVLFEKTDINGNFSMNLPPDNYILVARGKFDSKDLFCYYGGNPVRVAPFEVTGLNMSMAYLTQWMTIIPEENESEKTGIFGMVLHNKEPLENAEVIAFLDPDTYFRGPGFAQVQTDEQGDFNLDLSPGKYYIVVRKRNSPNDIGPLKQGEYFGYYENNPVEIKKGLTAVFISAIVKEKKDSPDSVITASGTFAKKESFIKGKITDINGNPVTGIYAGLYTNSSMIEKPAFMSEKTNESGEFKIYINTSGKYFLGARSNLGGPPKEKEFLGWYTNTPDHSIEILQNDNKNNILIVVEPVPSSEE
ncbi:carboxypeptidase regulatory-like domain-containing protein [Candidatus Poribacteria bacterium]|nr:carboxypeptidase regulatory-like domain-containing protein [Candidatus Poribacteria bacterium]